MTSQVFATSVFVYNYLTNIYGSSYAEDLGDEPVRWGYDSVFMQTCVVNEPGPEEADAQYAAAAKEISDRRTTQAKIVTTLTAAEMEPLLPGCCPTASKALITYKKPGANKAVGMVSEPSVNLKKLLSHSAFKQAHIGTNIAKALGQGLLEIRTIRRKNSNAIFGFAIICPLKQMTILESVTLSSTPTGLDITDAIDSVLQDSGLPAKPVIVIVGEGVAADINRKGTEKLGTINYFVRDSATTAPVHIVRATGSAVLLDSNEYSDSVDTLRTLGLPIHNDLPKNWDSLAALSHIVNDQRIRKSSPILDAGGEYYSTLLHQLSVLGYKRLYCINLAFKEARRISGINYDHGDITQSVFKPNTFAAVTCLSVIEHGVDPEKFFTEMYRIIKPGGLLFVSADYWKNKISAGGKLSYGAPIKIFSEKEVTEAIAIAQKCDFILKEPIDTRCREKVVACDGLRYTFLYLAFVKK